MVKEVKRYESEDGVVHETRNMARAHEITQYLAKSQPISGVSIDGHKFALARDAIYLAIVYGHIPDEDVPQ